MKCLTIQVDLSRADNFDCDDFVFLLRNLGRFPEVDKADQGYMGFNFFSEDLPELWKDLSENIYMNQSISSILKSSSIVVCESEEDADAELLLHHFDSNEKLDRL